MMKANMNRKESAMTSAVSSLRSAPIANIMTRELDRIERITGYRPVTWLSDRCKDSYRDCFTGYGFDWDEFNWTVSCIADSFIDFIQFRYQPPAFNM